MLGRGYREFTQYFPQPGWVEHDPEEILRVSLEAMARGAGGRRRAAGRARDHQPARDGGAVGPPHPRVRSRRRSSGRTGAPATAAASSGRPASRPLLRERTGLVADPYFSATKLEWLLRDPELRRRAGQRRARRGDGGKLAGGAAHRRAGSRERSHQRVPHAALRPRLARLAPGAARHFRGAARKCCRASCRPSGVVGETDPAHLGFAPADRRARGRPAVGAVRAGLLHRRAGQEHLRHRRVPAGVSRRPACPQPPRGVLATAACGPRGEPAYALEGSVFIAGAAVQWLRDGLGIIETRARDRARWREASRTPEGSLRAGVRRAGHAALGGGGAWDHHRAHPRHARGRTWCARRSRRSHSAAPTCCTP